MNELELNKIYCGDSYQLIKDIPDNSVDLIVTDPPYEFCMGGAGNSKIGQQKFKSKIEIYSLDTNITKSNTLTGGGCFGTKNRDYYNEFAQTNKITPQRQQYLDYIAKYGKDEESERLRVIANSVDNGSNTKFISQGITNDILDEMVRVMKKINIYLFCNKNQLRQYIDYFDDLGCNIDLLVWHKTNSIPTCNNTYLADLEYCVFAREKNTPLYGSYETKSKIYTSTTNKADKDLYLHPTIKPLKFIKNLILNSSVEGGGSVRSFSRKWHNCCGL